MSELGLRVAVATDSGMVRAANEDACLVEPLGSGSWLLVVCDGMGGHADGATASRTAVARIQQVVQANRDDPKPGDVLRQALLAAHDAVVTAAVGSNMGTTAVVAWVRGSKCWYGWVGDSRVYLLRDGAVVERSRDHSLVADALARGDITDEEALRHPDGNVITRALGAGARSAQPTVHPLPRPLRLHDGVLLCTDGLTDLVTDAEIAAACDVGDQDCDDIAKALVKLANDRGGHDNITVVFARLTQEDAASPLQRASSPDLGSLLDQSLAAGKTFDDATLDMSSDVDLDATMDLAPDTAEVPQPDEPEPEPAAVASADQRLVPDAEPPGQAAPPWVVGTVSFLLGLSVGVMLLWAWTQANNP